MLRLNNMFDSMVGSGVTGTTPAGREELPQPGGYVYDAAHAATEWFRGTSASPFIVAGKAGNLLGTKRLLLSSGVKTSSNSAAVKLTPEAAARDVAERRCCSGLGQLDDREVRRQVRHAARRD